MIQDLLDKARTKYVTSPICLTQSMADKDAMADGHTPRERSRSGYPDNKELWKRRTEWRLIGL